MLRNNSDTQYAYAQRMAYDVLVKYSDGLFPINPFKIISKIENIKLYTYKELAKNIQEKEFSNFSVEEIINTFPSNEGFIKVIKNNKYLLAYNDEMSLQRIRWTLFHELGHYFLGHLKDNNIIFFSNVETYQITKEQEANYFARHCCCPAPIVLYLVENTYLDPVNNIYGLIGMSRQVYENSLNHMLKYKEYYRINKFTKLIEKFFQGIRTIHGVYEIFNLKKEYLKCYPLEISPLLEECFKYLENNSYIKLRLNLNHKIYYFYLSNLKFKNSDNISFSLYIDGHLPWEANVFTTAIVYGLENCKNIKIEPKKITDVILLKEYQIDLKISCSEDGENN